jgi:hypothetical protein
MRMFAGLDVGFRRTAVCVVDEAGRIVWRGTKIGKCSHRKPDSPWMDEVMSGSKWG